MIKIGVDYYPDHWDRSMWEADIALMKETGVKIVRIAEFGWGLMEPEEGRFEFGWLDEAIELLERYGMEIVLGTPTNCAPVWLYKRYPETLNVERDGTPTKIGIRGHRCLSSPTFRRFAERIIDRMASRYAGRVSIKAWQIDNELEANHCCCPSCAERFREWLRAKYGTLDALNHAWGTDVWSGEISEWSQITCLLGQMYQLNWYNPAYVLDYERFAADSTVAYIEFEKDIIRRYFPDTPITTNSCFSFNQMDFYKSFAPLDFASYDNYPEVKLPTDPEAIYSQNWALDFVRGFKRQNFWIMEQLSGHKGCWCPISPSPRPNMIKGYSLQAIAHGADTVIHFRWRSAIKGAEVFWTGILDPSGVKGRRYEEFRSLCRTAEQLNGFEGTTLRSEVAVLYSPEQEYALKIQPQSEGFSYLTQLRLFHDAVSSLGVNVDVISSSEPLDGYRVVIMPTAFVAEKGLAEKLEAFAADGGTVILTNRSGVKDTDNACIMAELPSVFSKLCGCVVEEYDAVGRDTVPLVTRSGLATDVTGWCDILEPRGAEVWATYAGEYYSGRAAVTKNAFGKGCCYYVGTIGKRELYRSLMLEVLEAQEIEHHPELPVGVEMTVRSGEDKAFRFLFNNTEKPVSFTLGDEQLALEPFDMRITEV